MLTRLGHGNTSKEGSDHEHSEEYLHEDLHAPQNKKRCNFCTKVFSTVKGRQVHERNETCRNNLSESLQGGVNCEDCGKNFANQNALNYHQLFCKARPGAIDYKTFSSRNPDQKCNKCGKYFSKMSGLYAHSKFCKAIEEGNDETISVSPDKNDNIDHKETMESNVSLIKPAIDTKPQLNVNLSKPARETKSEESINVIHQAMKIKPEPNDDSSSEETDIVEIMRPSFSPFINLLPSLKRDDDNHDVTLVSSDRGLATCHAAVLAAVSPYFEKLLRNAFEEDENVLIVAENMTSQTLKNLIDFLYEGNIRKGKEEVCELKKILDEFMIKFSPELLSENDVDSSNESQEDLNENFCHTNQKEESGRDKVFVTKKKKRRKKLGKRGRSKKNKVKNSFKLKSVCDYCGLKFKTLFNTMKHIEEKHEEMFEEFAKIYIQTQCEHCKEKFLNRRCLSGHMQMQHPEIRKSTPEPKRHNRTRRDIKDGLPYNAARMCPHCTRILKNIDAFDDHVQAHLTGTDYPFSCEECGKRFQRSFNLRGHKKQHKISDTPVLCNYCGSVFQTEFEHRKHAKTHIPLFKKQVPQGSKKPSKKNISNQPSFLCNLCGKNFLSKYNYKTHMSIVHLDPEERITCPHCPQQFVGMHPLKTHIKLHLPPTVQCESCEKKFHTREYLRLHIKRKHMPDNLKDYVCGQCGKGFTIKETYEGHLNMHAGVKPFKCRYCEMCYQNRSNRHAHEKARHKELFAKIRTDNLGGVPVNNRGIPVNQR